MVPVPYFARAWSSVSAEYLCVCCVLLGGRPSFKTAAFVFVSLGDADQSPAGGTVTGKAEGSDRNKPGYKPAVKRC